MCIRDRFEMQSDEGEEKKSNANKIE
jgi:hypothetical protein